MFWFGFVLCFISIIVFVGDGIAASDSSSDDERAEQLLLAIMCLVIFIIGLLICFFTYEPFLCPGCHTESSYNVRYCAACGYELIPHCIECGEVCKTAFCKLCGAEQ